MTRGCLRRWRNWVAVGLPYCRSWTARIFSTSNSENSGTGYPAGSHDTVFVSWACRLESTLGTLAHVYEHVARTSVVEVRRSSSFTMPIAVGGQIRVFRSDCIFTRSIVNPQRRSCSAALTPEYSFTLEHRHGSPGGVREVACRCPFCVRPQPIEWLAIGSQLARLCEAVGCVTYADERLRNSSPATYPALDIGLRTHTTRAGMRCCEPPWGNIRIFSPGESGTSVRILTPQSDSFIVIAACPTP